MRSPKLARDHGRDWLHDTWYTGGPERTVLRPWRPREDPGGRVNRWLSADERYDQPQGLTGDARRAAFKWIGLLVAWVIVSGVLSITHLGLLLLLSTVGLIGYCAYSILRETPRAGQQAAGQWPSEQITDWHSRQQFNPPPGWPDPPEGWEPPPGWQPDRSWPPAPPGWEFWVWPDDRTRVQRMDRNRRTGRTHPGGFR